MLINDAWFYKIRIYIWHRVRVGVTHRIRGNFGFGKEVVEVVAVVEVVVPSGVEIVEVVDVVEVVVLGASSL